MRICRTLSVSILGALLAAGTLTFADADARSISYDLNIPSEDLTAALQSFAIASHHKLLYKAQLTAGKTSRALKGHFTAQEAMEALLSGTGLAYEITGSSVVLIKDQPTGKTSELREEGRTPSSSPAPPQSSGGQPILLAQVGPGKTASDVPVEKSDEPEKNKKREGLEEIVVTGTHIRGVAPSSPVQTISREDIDKSGYTGVADLLKSIPQDFSGIRSASAVSGSAASGAFRSLSNGIAPDLRGLGTGSTLTLIDGHRLAEDFIGGVDISLIPLNAIERVEVVADGSSTAYGSDAVAGVVNFILKKPFDGAATSLIVGRATQGGAVERDASQLLGKTWGGGGVMFDYEHFRQDGLNTSQRDFTSTAPSPWTILPPSTRDSLLLTLNQQLTEIASTYVEALYTHRFTETDRTFPPTFDSPTYVNQLQINAGATAKLSQSWQAALSISEADQRTSSVEYEINGGVRSPQPISTDDVHGKTQSVELTADGAIPWVAETPMRSAIGAGFRRESYEDANRASVPLAIGSRDIEYIFEELNVPLVTPSDRNGFMRLEVNLGARTEHYSDFGSKTVPKIGVLFVPFPSLTTRFTWSKSFRAPTVYDLYQQAIAVFYRIADPLATSGESNVLESFKGNQNLQPETARSWTLGADYRPESLQGFRVSPTYFYIDYTNRIARIADFFGSLSDPVSAPWVTRNPTAEMLQNIENAAQPRVYNTTGNPAFDSAPYAPGEIAAIVNAGPINVAKQRINGMDLVLDYRAEKLGVNWDLFLNGAYLHLLQQVAPAAPEIQLAGTIFNPPRFKGRGGVTGSVGSWEASTIVNYIGSETNTYLTSMRPVAAWTTVDLSIRYAPSLGGALSGLRVSLSAQNVLDRNPPYLVFDNFVKGVHYDSLNATPLGRFVSIGVEKQW